MNLASGMLHRHTNEAVALITWCVDQRAIGGMEAAIGDPAAAALRKNRL
jgi:hypothetical protein